MWLDVGAEEVVPLYVGCTLLKEVWVYFLVVDYDHVDALLSRLVHSRVKVLILQAANADVETVQLEQLLGHPACE